MTTEAKLREALEKVLNRYVELASSGDCGFWDPETESQVIEARAALALPATEIDEGMVERGARAIEKEIGNVGGCASDRCACYGASEVMDCWLHVTPEQLARAALTAALTHDNTNAKE